MTTKKAPVKKKAKKTKALGGIKGNKPETAGKKEKKEKVGPPVWTPIADLPGAEECSNLRTAPDKEGTTYPFGIRIGGYETVHETRAAAREHLDGYRNFAKELRAEMAAEIEALKGRIVKLKKRLKKGATDEHEATGEAESTEDAHGGKQGA